MSSPATTEEQPVFRIGIAMAGAVSAGAYTAGVIDYLLEALERWERAKARNRELGPAHPDYDPSVPMHKVVIDVIGGASAGGMTAAITTLALFEGIRPVDDDNQKGQGNKLFDAWVNLNDQDQTTLQQMFATGDIQGGKVPSLLNSTPIDAIADRAKVIDINRDIYSPDWPAYFSRDLELILTICSLRGIPIEIDFGAADSGEKKTSAEDPPAEKPAHKMYLHKGIAHFTIDPTRAQLDHLLRLNPRIEDDKNIVIECAKATGAFPVGLRPRQFNNLSHAYLRGQIQRMFGKEINIRWNRIPKPFSFTAIDGGTINNEPFDDVLRVLEERHAADLAGDQEQPAAREFFKNYAILMIDPFPNFEGGDNQEQYVQPDSIEKAVPQILSAIRRQAMIKEGELTRGFTGDYTRAMVFPVRRQPRPGAPGTDDGKTPYPIACGALDGFGGFFSFRFREHDFFLGRKNCQSFLRKHFSLREDQVFTLDDAGNPQIACSLFGDWKPGDPRYERFHYRKDEQPHFPIIPDLRVLNANSDDPRENGSLPARDYPCIGLAELQQLKKPLRRRVRKVLLTMLTAAVRPKKKSAPADPLTKEARRTVNRHLGDSWLGRTLLRITLILLGILLLPLLPVFLVLAFLLWHVAINYTTSKIFGSIVYDFKKRDLLRECPPQ